MSKGYVYILANNYMPGLVKIGRTTGDPEARAAQLYQTGVPAPFKVADYVLSPDCVLLETLMHEEFAEHRVNTGREFFKIEESLAIERLQDANYLLTCNYLDEFLPGYRPVYEPMALDERRVLEIAKEVKLDPLDVAKGFNNVTADELRPALLRVVDELIEQDKTREAEAQAMLKVVE